MKRQTILGPWTGALAVREYHLQAREAVPDAKHPHAHHVMVQEGTLHVYVRPEAGGAWVHRTVKAGESTHIEARCVHKVAADGKAVHFWCVSVMQADLYGKAGIIDGEGHPTQIPADALRAWIHP